MKRIRQWIFNGAAGLSLVLCIATAGLWVRSYWKSDNFMRVAFSSDSVAYVRNSFHIGAYQGRFLANWNDMIWLWSNPYTATIVASMNEKSGAGWYQEAPSDFNEVLRQRWDFALAGCRFVHDKSDGRHSILHPGQQTALDPDFVDFTAVIPVAYVWAAMAVLPVAWMVMWRKRRKFAEPGRCKKCRYDLRATPQRCPECGTAQMEGEMILE